MELGILQTLMKNIWIYLHTAHTLVTISVNIYVQCRPIDETIRLASVEKYRVVPPNSVLVELDIMIPKHIYTDMAMEYQREIQARRSKRKATQFVASRWPQNIIPFKFETGLDDYAIIHILKAMEVWQEHTCIHFRPWDPERDKNFIRIFSGDGCWSYVGMDEEPQELSLGEGCIDEVTILHELGHAIGLFHEQNRPDRDDYVEIVYDNIEEERQMNFLNFNFWIIHTYSVPYDYESIMHYGQYAFRRDDSEGPTIRTADPYYQNLIGESKFLSFRDVAIVNKMLGCSNHCTRRDSCDEDLGVESYLGKNCTCIRKDTWDDQYYLPPELPLNNYDPCVNYTEIGSVKRATNYTLHEDESPLCDHGFINEDFWYRFDGAILSEECPPLYSCGTVLPIWINGSHPTDEHIIGVTAYINDGDECLSESLPVQIKLCKTGLPEGKIPYYVYKLKNPGFCDSAYCTESYTGEGLVSDIENSPCGNYTNIGSRRRLVSNSLGTDEYPLCDNGYLQEDTWYRFGETDEGKIPETCPPIFSCGTILPIWLGHEHREDYSIHNTTAFINDGVSCKSEELHVKYKRCPGSPDFIIYQLEEPPYCDAAYCIEN